MQKAYLLLRSFPLSIFDETSSKAPTKFILCLNSKPLFSSCHVSGLKASIYEILTRLSFLCGLLQVLSLLLQVPVSLLSFVPPLLHCLLVLC